MDKVDVIKILSNVFREIPFVGIPFDLGLFFYSIYKRDFMLAIFTMLGLLLSILGMGPLTKLFTCLMKCRKLEKY